MNPQVSELPNLCCWVQKKKRSLPSIFGESYVKKWLVIDPASKTIEYADTMHGTTKLLGAFENVIGVKFDHKHKSNRALAITLRKKMPRQAQDAHETTLFVFEEDLSLSLAIHIFYSHPLRLLSEAEKTFLPKHIFEMLPKPAQPQRAAFQRATKPVDVSEQRQETGYFGFNKIQHIAAHNPSKPNSKTEGSSLARIHSPSHQAIHILEKVPEHTQSGDSRPAVALENQQLKSDARPEKSQVNQVPKQQPFAGIPEPAISRRAPLRLNLRLNTTRDALKSKIEESNMAPPVGITSNRILQIRPPKKPENITYSLPAGRSLDIPAASARQPFKPIKFSLGTSRIKEQPLMLPKPLPLDK